MIIKNKARVNAFYYIYLPPRFLSRKTHGVSLYAKVIIFGEIAIFSEGLEARFGPGEQNGRMGCKDLK